MAIRFKKASKDAAGLGINLAVLKRENGIADGSNLGGAFRLPSEFPADLYASAYIKKGSAVDGMKQRQIISGTDISADGWTVWKFPEGHPDADKPHEVNAESGTYVLMFRSLEVQEAVNYVCGEASRDRMRAEVAGETVAGNSPEEEPGVLTDEALNATPQMRAERANIERERLADEQARRQTSVFAGQRPKSKVITKSKKRVTH